MSRTTTGVKYVSKQFRPTNKRGFDWRYYNKTDDVCIYSSSLFILKRKIMKLGLKWEIIDKQKYIDLIINERNYWVNNLGLDDEKELIEAIQ